jgi:MoaA/NifB/PqqE/SkfB family radical SAM enzyme
MDKVKKPIYADFLVTPACNFHCSFCSASAEYKKEDIKILSLEKINDIFNQMDEIELLRTSIEGGEPFLRDDIIEIIHMADSHDFEYYVNTNASLIDHHMAKKLGTTKIP